MMDQVTLTVSLGEKPKNETWWRHTTGTNGLVYAFFFKDKNEKESGHLWTVMDKKKMNFMVHLANESKGFEILNVEIHYGEDQFSYEPKGSSGKLAVIRNLNDKVVQGVYCVVVLDGTGPQKALVYCDPMISNLPH